jgi:hypothetical protein
MAFLTLLDWSRRQDPEGHIDEIAELLSQCNEIYKEMPWREGNLPTGHQGTVRTGLPQGTFRAMNQGITGTKSLTAQIQAGAGVLAALSQIDKDIADLNGDPEGVRVSEDNAHLEGMSQQMATTLFYGNSVTNPTQFTGLAPLYNTVSLSNAQNAKNVIDGGGTGSNNLSIWLSGWGDRTGYGYFPKGSLAGLQFEDKGDVLFAYDASNLPYRAYTSWFEWKAGLFVEDWRYFVRICNIDTTSAGLAGANPYDIFAGLSKAVVRLPTMDRRASGITETDAPDEPAPGIVPAIYVNRTGREYMDIQAIRDRNVLLGFKDYAGEPVTEFRQVPIRVNDVLTNTEARIT